MKTTQGRKLYSIEEIYHITFQALRTMSLLKRAKTQGDIDQKLIERIMLAVTEVNGCAICSYAHTKIALEAGLSSAEIQNMLSGIGDDIPAQDIQAIMFAQHYADTRGFPTKVAWMRIIECYGRPKANGILGASRVIMMGNAFGIPWSAFLARLKGTPDERSRLPYELGTMIGSILLIPVALIHALISKLLGTPIIRF